ncbi:EAL domain-containing protein [Ancylobacter sp. A5.8]|uniref:EAL domain-containing protein n=1 Tax=Ancylobacter gelatini TaxID=2919920 RepID=UPI001F4E7375|nr:EAL domain-containing protein [Ancylobacter gelatini]MCJ8144922.1 EAL domain-containing protein [Ancylobacter gelatini]
MVDGVRLARPDSELPLTPEAMQQVVCDLGVAVYSWSIDSDELSWSDNARDLLGPHRWQRAHTGKDYGALIEAGSGLCRAEAAQASPLHSGGLFPGLQALSPPDLGRARPFETVYCLSLPPEYSQRRLWIEDRGIGCFDANGRLVRVDGMIRRYAVGRPVRYAKPPGMQADRQRLAAMLDERLAASYADGGEFGFMLVSIDQLSQLNEAYGYRVTDEVIDIVALRLAAQLREGEEMARFSGSKFALLLRDTPGESLPGAAHRFLTAVNGTAARTAAGAVAVAISAGGLVAPRQGRNVGEIFARAQDTLQNVRASARGTFLGYSPSFDREAERRANLRFADDIVSALSEGRVKLAFQPIAFGATRQVAFHECLVRIESHSGHVFDGSAIIPTAERFGLTRLIDLRSLELAFSALEADPTLRLSVNVSPGSIHDGAWLALLEERARQGFGERLIVELTESATIPDLESVRRTVNWLHDLGCKVAMDDFGVGYTSFRNLRRLGVDMLKIDGSFICSLMQSTDDRHFVRALLDLARNLGIETVAEWVLDEATGELLTEWGCTYLQGQLIGLAGCAPPHPAA